MESYGKPHALTTIDSCEVAHIKASHIEGEIDEIISVVFVSVAQDEVI